ncbi:MAG: VanW family protein, partial [Actinobacteria bacterium]|nr:VanW family protein [Actinomycetota bacterium]
SDRLAEGVTVAGVDVGGLSRTEARRLLEGRAAAVAKEPIVFTAGEQSFPIKASALGVEADWGAALDAAAREGEGFGPVRGYRRLQTRFFGAEVAPPVQAYTAALDYKLAGLAREVDRPHVEAKLVRRGLNVLVVPGQTGIRVDRDLAADTVVRALARLERGRQVPLPVVVDPIEVTTDELAGAVRDARVALSAPVRLTGAAKVWRLPRWRIAQLLTLPQDGTAQLAIAGPGADAYFRKLRKTVERPPRDAEIRAASGVVSIVPAKDGLALDIPATAKAILEAATSPGGRRASLVLVTAEPERSTEEARALGIERRLGTYYTANAGTDDRITNLRRGIELLNGALVAPGAEFSFNERVGPRTIERGFRPAPVIIRDEYEEDVGGGVSQVGTTVFNSAWESGVKILERNPHSLYIARYQLGRDATVNYPDLDVRFLNDTPNWILVAASWDGGGIAVSLYGGGPERRVESSEGTVRVTGPGPVRRVPDPTLEKGTEIVEEEGSDARTTSVERTVYAADDTVLHDETWNTSYRGEFRVIRVGTKPKPAPPKPPKDEDPTATTVTGTTTTTTTTPTTTTPATPRP